MSTRRALVCSYYPPRGDGDSGARRVLNHMEFLRADAWAVDFYAVNGLPDAAAARGLRARGIGVYDVGSIEFEELVGSGVYDVALFAFWQTAEYLMPVLRSVSPDTRVIVDSVDLQFLRDARRTLGPQAEQARRALLADEYGSEFVGELNVYAAADGVMTVSAKEARLIDDFLSSPGQAVSVPDNEELEPSSIPFSKRRGIVFVGSFQHPPNADAVRHLCHEIVPRLPGKLREKHPVTIVGTGLDDTVRSYADGVEGVTLVGWVPSVVPYLEGARISVVPLLYGAGTKRKLIQSLMVGTPAVSTSIGTEGLELVDGEDILVADDAASFARAIEELVSNRTLWKRVARGARAKVAHEHGKAIVRKHFHRAVESVLARHPKSTLLPPSSKERYDRRMMYLENQRIARNAAVALDRMLPREASVAVMSDGSAELLQLGASNATPFPTDESGAPLGYPASADEAIACLEQAKAEGLEHLLIPSTAAWWLDYHGGFADHLATTCTLIFEDELVGRIYRLRPADGPAANGSADGWHALAVVERTARAEPAPPEVRLIAFYLPQFHPIPENDEWWGEGFTEWSNVAAAQPLFEGHYQPHIPADLSFYDLRISDVRAAQAELARNYGISAFCYYHYWFSGKRLLEQPFDEVLTTGEPDFPFCLCWANEPWSRRWHGRNEDVLQPQAYSLADDREHVRWLLPALADDRSVRIDGKPVFIVYQARDLPDPARTVELWRDEIDRAGLPGIYLLTVETGWDEGWDATQVGFDAKVMFRPQFTTLGRLPQRRVDEKPDLKVYDYAAAARAFAAPDDVPYPHFETVCSRWDNTPRAGERGVVLHEATPELYQQWLEVVLGRARQRPADERVVFVNAWNEWGEGCHLEPDVAFGRGYLEATQRALRAASAARASSNGGTDGALTLALLAGEVHR